MTNDEIIEMARQAGFVIHTHKPSLITVENEETWVCVNKELEAFAKLVAKKAYLEGVNSGISAEREACADLCATFYDEMWEEYAEAGNELAEIIRARGEA